eukprot:PhM_4_TR4329/c0_g1_i1/m.70762/K14324/SAP18; histone deacetylase complex subunit SAP18
MPADSVKRSRNGSAIAWQDAPLSTDREKCPPRLLQILISRSDGPEVSVEEAVNITVGASKHRLLWIYTWTDATLADLTAILLKRGVQKHQVTEIKEVMWSAVCGSELGPLGVIALGEEKASDRTTLLSLMQSGHYLPGATIVARV